MPPQPFLSRLPAPSGMVAYLPQGGWGPMMSGQGGTVPSGGTGLTTLTQPQRQAGMATPQSQPIQGGAQSILNALRGIAGTGSLGAQLGAGPQVPGQLSPLAQYGGGGLGLLSSLLGIQQAFMGQGPEASRIVGGLGGAAGAIRGGAALTNTALPSGVGPGLGAAGSLLGGIGLGLQRNPSPLGVMATALPAFALGGPLGIGAFALGNIATQLFSKKGDYIKSRQGASEAARNYIPMLTALAAGAENEEALKAISGGYGPLQFWTRGEGMHGQTGGAPWPFRGGYELESQMGPMNEQLQKLLAAKRANWAGQLSPADQAALTRLESAAQGKLRDLLFTERRPENTGWYPHSPWGVWERPEGVWAAMPAGLRREYEAMLAGLPTPNLTPDYGGGSE